jgi:hypothetical protein
MKDTSWKVGSWSDNQNEYYSPTDAQVAHMILPLRTSDKNVYAFPISSMRATNPARLYFPWLYHQYHHNNIRWRVQIINAFIMQLRVPSPRFFMTSHNMLNVTVRFSFTLRQPLSWEITPPCLYETVYSIQAQVTCKFKVHLLQQQYDGGP